MTENDYIAEYVKEKLPSILNTADFRIWKCIKTVSNVVGEITDTLVEAFRNIDYEELEAYMEEQEDDESNDG